MQIMSLFAKLTLDKTEYEKGIEEAEQKAESFDGPKEQEAKIEVDNYKGKVDEAAKKAEELKDPEKKATLDVQDVEEKVNQAVKKEEEIKDPEATAKLDTEEFDTKIGGVKQKIEEFKTVASELFGTVAQNLVSSGITFLIQQFVQGVADALDLAKNLGFEVKQGAESVGISTKAYQEWSHVMKGTDASVSDLSKGVENVNAILEGTADEKITDAFKQLGLGAEDANGNLLTTEQLLDKTIEALAQMEDEGAREELVKTLFGNGKLNSMLEKGSVEIKRLRREAEKMGLVLSEDQIESSVEFNNTLERLETSIDTLRQSLLMNLVGPLQTVVDTMTQIMAFFMPGQWGNGAAEAEFQSIDENAKKSALDLAGTAAQAESLIDKMLALGPASEQTAEQHKQWKEYAGWLIENIPSLRNEINLETGEISGEADALKANVEQWKERQKAMIMQQALADKREVVASKLAEAIDAETKATMAETEADGARAKAIEFLNQELENNSDLRGIFEANYKGATETDKNGNIIIGKDATLEDLQSLNETIFNFDQGAYREYGQVMGELEQKTNAVTDAQEKAEKAMEDYNDSMTLYESAAESAVSVLGITDKAAEDAKDGANEFTTAMNNIPTKKDIYIITHYLDDGNPDGGRFFHNGMTIMQNAKGQWDVPYDNYPTLLHRNEMVLSASRARDYRENNETSGVGVDLSSLPEMIIGAIRQGMENVSVKSFLNGREITDEVNRMMINELKARRYAT